jgi:hypothetical protein
MSTYAEGTGNPNGAAAAIHNLFCRSAALVVRAQAAEVPYRHLLSIHEEMPIVAKKRKGGGPRKDASWLLLLLSYLAGR